MANAFTLTADGTSRVLAVFNHAGRAFDSAVLDLCQPTQPGEHVDWDEVDEADEQGLIVVGRDGSRTDRLTRDGLRSLFRKAPDGTSVNLTIPRRSAGFVTVTFHEVR